MLSYASSLPLPPVFVLRYASSFPVSPCVSQVMAAWRHWRKQRTSPPNHWPVSPTRSALWPAAYWVCSMLRPISFVTWSLPSTSLARWAPPSNPAYLWLSSVFWWCHSDVMRLQLSVIQSPGTLMTLTRCIMGIVGFIRDMDRSVCVCLCVGLTEWSLCSPSALCSLTNDCCDLNFYIPLHSFTPSFHYSVGANL